MMFKHFDEFIEDFRIYFAVGAFFIFVWMLLPLLGDLLSSDLLVFMNTWSQVGGQLIIAGCLLPWIPKRLRFFTVILFLWYFIDFLFGSLDQGCLVAVMRFDFSPGDMPSCLFSRAI